MPPFFFAASHSSALPNAPEVVIEIGKHPVFRWDFFLVMCIEVQFDVGYGGLFSNVRFNMLFVAVHDLHFLSDFARSCIGFHVGLLGIYSLPPNHYII